MLFPLATFSLSLLTGPTVFASPVPPEAQWAAVVATARVETDQARVGAAVCVGVRGRSAYLLTAGHVVPPGKGCLFAFATRASYPHPARRVVGGEVVLRLADPDVALVRLPVGDEPVPVVRLAGPGERPKRFPFAAVSVGCPDGSPPVCRAERVSGKTLVRRPGGGVAFFWEVAVPPVGGMSGGPIVGPDGRVIGLCTAAQEGKGYFVHLDEILAGLKQGGFGWLFEPPSS